MLQVSILSVSVSIFVLSVSDSIVSWSVSVSIFVFRICGGLVCYEYSALTTSIFGLLLSTPSCRYVSLSVSMFRSLERGGVSELSQAQVDR